MTGLLTIADGLPVAVENPDAQGPVVIVCEHASNRLPERLGTLGLSPDLLDAHIAWDPGALAVSRLLSARLDAVVVYQRFSRLAYDCNRPPEAEGAMPAVSEIFEIPGNHELSDEDRRARTEAIYLPFRDAVAALIAERTARGQPSILVTMHSFTPVYHGRQRDVELGILHDADSRLADRMLSARENAGNYVVRRNEPYGPADGVTHTLVEQGLKRGLPNVMIEMRNDIVRDDKGQGEMAAFLADLINEGVAGLLPAPKD